MKILLLNLAQRSYPIYIGKNLLQDPQIWDKHISGNQVMIVSNETVAKFYLQSLKTTFSNKQCDVILLPDGEQYKNLQIWEKIFDSLLAHKHHRSTTLIALGGGVICDITGFAAACYQRGVAFIPIPTSLLAQVDASIGGKTAVNHPLGKNMIGAFHQPQCVVIDVDTLSTLPDREFNAGVAEIIKAALIRDSSFFKWLEDNMPSLLAREEKTLIYAIERACAIKAEIVSEDEKEISQVRALLNLGHTFGHAIEQTLGYGVWLHGEAVAAGLVLAAELSLHRGWLTKSEVMRIKALLQAANLPIRLPDNISCDRIISALTRDKKAVDSRMRLVLLKALGRAELISDMEINQVKQILDL